MATIRPTSSSSTKTRTTGGLEPLSPEVPSFTITPAKIAAQDNPVTYTDASGEVVPYQQEHKDSTISSSTAVTLDQSNSNGFDKESTSASSDEAEDAPQSKADILAAAGVSINLEELQALQAQEAPLELVTEFLRCVLGQEYHAAKILCEYILRFEPDNATAREFYPTIMERIRLDDQMDTESGSSSSSSSSGHSDTSSSSSDDDDDDVQPVAKKYSHSCHTHSTTQASNTL